MESSPPYFLHSASVVITAENHDPMILNPSLLADRKIVPADWKAVKSMTGLLESAVQYEAILLEMDSSKLVFTEGFDSPFGDDYHIYDVANAYLEKVPYTPYRSLGINYRVYMNQDNPEQWIYKRFFSPGLWAASLKVLFAQPNVTIDVGDGLLCKLSFNGGNRKPIQGESEKIVLVDVNIDHPGPLDADRMRNAISRWRERQNFVVTVLDKLLRETQA